MPNTIILGQHPGRLEVMLVRGDSAPFVATCADASGYVTDWPAAPTLEFADGNTRAVIATHAATIDGEHASWTLNATQVQAIYAGSSSRNGRWSTLARLTLPDTDDATGSVEYAGEVNWSDGWTAGDRTQRVTFTLPGGPPGPAGPPGPPGPGSAGVSVDHGSVGATLTITQAGSHELDLSGNLAVTVSTTGDVSLRVHGTGAVTVAGQSFDIDGVGVILVVTWPRSQEAYKVGAGGGETPDATPPSNMSGLSVTPNSDGVSANATWVAATDAESDVRYRARVYPTGGTVPAWPTSGPLYDITGTSVAITGLSPSTDYSIQMHAYSNGGASATVATTFSTPSAPPVEPTWVHTENFTPNGAVIGRELTTGGLTWTAGTGAGQGGAETDPMATGGKAVNVHGPAEGAQITLPQANVAAQMDYQLAGGGGRVYLWVTSVDSTNSLTVTIQGTQVYLFRGGPSLVTLSGDFTDVPSSGTLTVYYNDGVVTIVTGAGTATATVALNSSFTGTGRKCGFTTYGIGTTADNFKAALL